MTADLSTEERRVYERTFLADVQLCAQSSQKEAYTQELSQILKSDQDLFTHEITYTSKCNLILFLLIVPI